MKRNVPRTGSAHRPAPHCSRRTFGQGKGINCGYGRRGNRVPSRPLTSIMSSLIGGVLGLADRSIRRLSTSIMNSPLLGDGSRPSSAELAEFEIRREDHRLIQDNLKKLPENHEESHSSADKQK